MVDEDNSNKTEATLKSRRDVIKTSVQVAVTAPAVAMLLSASTKQAAAQITPYLCAGCGHILDDFTFGNEAEDIDAINLGSNFNFENGTPQQDDHI